MSRRSRTSRGFFRDALPGSAGFRATLPHLVLVRAAVLLGILAVIAGFFGMHVMTSGHASHAGAGHSDARSAAPHSAAHAGGSHSGTSHAGDPAHPGGDAVVVLSAGAACAEACPGAAEPGTSCVPSPGSGVLTVVTPPAAVIRTAPPAGAAAPAYSYRPSSPTPCELSVSRT